MGSPEGCWFVLLFPFYAVVIWLLAAKWRREWRGFAVVLGGTAFLLLVEYTLFKLGSVKIGVIEPETAIALLVPFTILIFLVGLFIACQPRSAPSEVHCRTCFYDLTGLQPVELKCPECGAAWRGRGSGYAVGDQRRVPRHGTRPTAGAARVRIDRSAPAALADATHDPTQATGEARDGKG